MIDFLHGHLVYGPHQDRRLHLDFSFAQVDNLHDGHIAHQTVEKFFAHVRGAEGLVIIILGPLKVVLEPLLFSLRQMNPRRNFRQHWRASDDQNRYAFDNQNSLTIIIGSSVPTRNKLRKSECNDRPVPPPGNVRGPLCQLSYPGRCCSLF